MRSLVVLALRLLAPVLLGFSVASAAVAQVPPYAPAYGTAGGTVFAGPISGPATVANARMIAGSNASSIGELLATDNTFLQLLQRPANLGDVAVVDRVAANVGGKDTAMAIARTLPWSAVARGAARALPYVAAADTAYELYKAYRCYKDPSSGTGIGCDNGQPAEDQPTWQATCSLGNKTATGITPTAAANEACRLGAAAASSPGYTYAAPSLSCTTNQAGTSATCEGYSHYTCTQVSNGQSCGEGNQYVNAGPVKTIAKACPAFTDALNPANSGPAGAAPGPDGKCPTGRYNGTSAPDAADKVLNSDPASQNDWKTKAPSIVADILKLTAPGLDLANPPVPDASPGPGTLTGPSTVTGPTTTTTTTPSGGGAPSTTTSTPTTNITYTTNNYTTNTTTTTTNGDTTTTTNAPQEKVETCGLPGKPACKIDETGTPSYVPPDDPFQPHVDQDAQNTATASTSVVPPDFGFIGAPPLAECSAFQFPHNMGSLDPCGVVGDVRSVMAYLWPLVAAWLCFGMVRQTVNGG